MYSVNYKKRTIEVVCYDAFAMKNGISRECHYGRVNLSSVMYWNTLYPRETNNQERTCRRLLVLC